VVVVRKRCLTPPPPQRKGIKHFNLPYLCSSNRMGMAADGEDVFQPFSTFKS